MQSDEFEIFKRDPARVVAEEKGAEGLGTPAESQQPRVLVIDDDPMMLTSLEMALQLNYNVVCCGGGNEGIESVNDGVSVVVLDIKMQDRDGFDTYHEIKKKFPHLPIIFFTAYQDLKDLSEILNQYHPFGYIIKGTDFQFLMSLIKSAIDYYNRIQENNRLVRELRTLNVRLEERVRERTATVISQKAELDKQIHMARKIQTALLPARFPEIPGARLAFRYEPAQDVGGDFLDFYYRPGRSELGLFICDVSGHGIGAAFLSAMVKMSLGVWGDIVIDPVSILEEIHGSLYGKMSGNFLTACACCLNLETGQLTYARAGHPPFIVARKNGELEVPRANGRALLEHLPPNSVSREIMLEPGDKILMYTDGITEARDSTREMLGEEGLVGMFREHREHAPDIICRNIFDGINTYAGLNAESEHRLEDDFSLLVVEYTGES